MEEDKNIMIICMRENTGHTVGIDATCRSCGHHIWISDSTISAVKQNNPEVDLTKNPPTAVCLECGMKAMEEMEDPHIADLTEEQMKELVDGISTLGNNYAAGV